MHSNNITMESNHISSESSPFLTNENIDSPEVNNSCSCSSSCSCCKSCSVCCDKVKTWCSKKKLKHKQALSILKKLIGLFFYNLDFGLDIRTSVKHFNDGNYLLGCLTLLLALLPILISGIWLIVVVIPAIGKSVSWKCNLALAIIVFIPIVPILLLLWDIFTSIIVMIIIMFIYSRIQLHKSDPDDDDNIASRGAKFLFICEAMVESYPQAGLQMAVAFQALKVENSPDGPDALLWLSIVVSLGALAWAVSTSFLFENANISSIIIFLFFGFLTVASRLVVCCLYSMLHEPMLFFVPFFSELSASFIVWYIKRRSRLTRCAPLYVCGTVCSSEVGNTVLVVSWFGTAAFNGFTLSGMVVSLINLGFAIGGFFVNVPQSIVITAVTLSITICLTNLIFTTVAFFNDIKNDWFCVNDKGGSWMY